MTGRRLLVTAMAMAMILVVAGPAGLAGAAGGPPEAAASPHTRTDPTGDCVGEGGAGGPRCDLVRIKVVNKTANVKLIATYAGVPYLPFGNSPLIVGNLRWILESETDREVRIARSNGTLYATVFEVPYLGGEPVCWSGDGGLPAPTVDGQRVIVVVPRACLCPMGDCSGTGGGDGGGGNPRVRVYATTNRLTQSMAAFATDRAPNTGFTAWVAVAP